MPEYKDASVTSNLLAAHCSPAPCTTPHPGALKILLCVLDDHSKGNEMVGGSQSLGEMPSNLPASTQSTPSLMLLCASDSHAKDWGSHCPASCTACPPFEPDAYGMWMCSGNMHPALLFVSRTCFATVNMPRYLARIYADAPNWFNQSKDARTQEHRRIQFYHSSHQPGW